MCLPNGLEDRFVLINGERFVTGDDLADGARLVDIRRGGVPVGRLPGLPLSARTVNRHGRHRAGWRAGLAVDF